MAYSFQTMFFIGQNLKHVLMYIFFSWTFDLLFINSSMFYYFDFISHHIKEILYVNTNSRGNQLWNKNKEIYIFTCFWYWCWKILFFMWSYNPLSTIFNFSQFHEHFQKQPFADVLLKNSCYKTFRNILD